MKKKKKSDEFLWLTDLSWNLLQLHSGWFNDFSSYPRLRQDCGQDFICRNQLEMLPIFLDRTLLHPRSNISHKNYRFGRNHIIMLYRESQTTTCWFNIHIVRVLIA